jgi:hypothetical protein
MPSNAALRGMFFLHAMPCASRRHQPHPRLPVLGLPAMPCRHGNAKLADVGLAKVIALDLSAVSGDVMGTLTWVSEQAGRDAGRQAGRHMPCAAANALSPYHLAQEASPPKSTTALRAMFPVVGCA